MKESKIAVEDILENIRIKDRFSSGQKGQSEEEWTILKSQFKTAVTSVVEQLNATQLKLQEEIEKNGRYENELKKKCQELQRLKLLLPVKDELIRKQENEVKRLNHRIRFLEEQMNSKMLPKIMKTKSVKRLDESSILCESLSQFCLTDLQQATNNDKSAKKRDNQKDKEINQLKNENKRLKNALKMITSKVQLMQIENEHLKAEYELLNSRQKYLTRFLENILMKKGKSNCVQSWNQRCQELDLFVNDFQDRHQNDHLKKKVTCNSVMTEPLHPPTPHFSTNIRGFGKKPKYSQTTDQIFPLEQEVSLGQIAPSVADSCPPSI